MCWARNLTGSADDAPSGRCTTISGHSTTRGARGDGSVECWGYRGLKWYKSTATRTDLMAGDQSVLKRSDHIGEQYGGRTHWREGARFR